MRREGEGDGGKMEGKGKRKGVGKKERGR